VVPKKKHGTNSCGTSCTQRPSTKFVFQSQKFIENLEFFFWKACIVSFQKNYPFIGLSNWMKLFDNSNFVLITEK
jgi:hypothetical protein